MATQKELFALEMIKLSKVISSQIIGQSKLLTDQYFDLGFNGGGSNTIIDTDLDTFDDLDATDITNVITALQQITNYFGNSAVATGDYASSYNNLIYAKLN